MGFILAIFGGCPAMIYCNAGAVAIVLVPLVQSHGVEHVFIAFILVCGYRVTFIPVCTVICKAAQFH